MKRKSTIILAISVILFLTFLLVPEIRNLSSMKENYVETVDISTALELMGESNPVKESLRVAQWEYNSRESARKQQLIIEEYQVTTAQSIQIEDPPLEEEAAAGIPLSHREPLSGKIAYLTFDDGPSKFMTTKILQVLDDYDIKATFFVLGKMVDKNPQILKETYDKGHSIGNHTYSHNYDHIYKSTENFIDEVYRTQAAIRTAVDDDSYETLLVRLPGGSHAAYKKPTVEAVEDAGMKSFDWNALNGDSEGKDLTVEYMYNRFKETYKQRDQVILLMHDTDEKEASLKSLPVIIEHLLMEGYSFRTLDDYQE